tara:strand:- start:12720 stop:14333 length:1614 start_codon:yes stop_codon:yes gene_type:complete
VYFATLLRKVPRRGWRGVYKHKFLTKSKEYLVENQMQNILRLTNIRHSVGGGSATSLLPKALLAFALSSACTLHAQPNDVSTQSAEQGVDTATEQDVFRADAAKAAGISSQQMANQPGAMWLVFLSELKRVAQKSPEIEAGSVRLEAERENSHAERGDLGLSLSASHTRYPGGGGAQNSGSFTSLEEYSEARLSLDLMHLLARRGAKIDSAEATAQQVEYELELAAVASSSRLLEDTVTVWSLKFRREALKNALVKIDSANRKLKISEDAGMPEITKATPSNVAEAIILKSSISNNLKAISPLIPDVPNLPPYFLSLPSTPPDADRIYQIALKNPGTKSLQSKARAFQHQARSLRGNGFEFSVHGGYVVQEVGDIGATEEGTQYGATMVLPLGSRDSHKRKAAELQARAAQFDAQAAIRSSQDSLVDLRDEWSRSLAVLNQAQEDLRQQARLLETMERRAASPQSGRAPEPWEVEIQSAKFWVSVAKTWEQRAEWMKNVLTWGLIDPEYIIQEAMPTNPEISHSLCAPLSSCGSSEI